MGLYVSDNEKEEKCLRVVIENFDRDLKQHSGSVEIDMSLSVNL